MKSIDNSEVSPTKLQELTAKVNQVLMVGFDASCKLLDSRRSSNPYQVRILRMLLDSTHQSSESALALLAKAKIWDADVLVRSVVEGTVKFVYLTIGSDDEVATKLTEYDGLLPKVYQLKRHRRLDEFMKFLDDPQDDQWKPFHEMLLKEEEGNRIRELLPRRERSILENRWAFPSLLRSLSESGIKVLENSNHLFYNYGMSSHVLHQDADGVGMRWERSTREPKRRDAVELGHACRQLSDIFTMSSMRHAMALRIAVDIKEPNLSVYEDYQYLLSTFQHYVEEFSRIEYDMTGEYE